MRAEVPSWLLQAMPDQAEVLQKAAVAATVGHAKKCLKAITDAVALEEKCLDKADLDSAEQVARILQSAVQELMAAFTLSRPADARPVMSGGKTWEQRSYDRCWYYTMARRPADLLHLTYAKCKDDPRIIALWAEAKALDAAGKLNSAGKVK